MTDQAKETVFGIIERWGFPTLVALAAGWVLRHDVLLPLVEEHRTFVKSLSETQREISQAVAEQTRLLYRLQPQAAEHER
ncbi:MAG: hypothetical protein ACKOC8_09375 [Pirellulales bacterium]